MHIVKLDHPVDFLLNEIQKRFDLPDRADAMAKIGARPCEISKIRHDRKPPSAKFLLRAHDRTGMPLTMLRSILNLKPY